MTTLFAQNYLEDLPKDLQIQIMNTVKTTTKRDRDECNRIRDKYLFPEHNGRHRLLQDLMEVTASVDCYFDKLKPFGLECVLNEQIYNTYVDMAIEDVVNDLNERELDEIIFRDDDIREEDDDHLYLYPFYRDARHGEMGFPLRYLRDYCAKINKPDLYRKMLTIDEQYNESMKAMLKESYTITLQEAILINKYDLIIEQDFEEDSDDE